MARDPRKLGVWRIADKLLTSSGSQERNGQKDGHNKKQPICRCAMLSTRYMKSHDRHWGSIITPIQPRFREW